MHGRAVLYTVRESASGLGTSRAEKVDEKAWSGMVNGADFGIWHQGTLYQLERAHAARVLKKWVCRSWLPHTLPHSVRTGFPHTPTQGNTATLKRRQGARAPGTMREGLVRHTHMCIAHSPLRTGRARRGEASRPRSRRELNRRLAAVSGVRCVGRASPAPRPPAAALCPVHLCRDPPGPRPCALGGENEV